MNGLAVGFLFRFFDLARLVLDSLLLLLLPELRLLMVLMRQGWLRQGWLRQGWLTQRLLRQGLLRQRWLNEAGVVD